MKTCPHSVHSFKAVRSLLIVVVLNSKNKHYIQIRIFFLQSLPTNGWPVGLLSLISDKAATAFATTIGLESLNSSFNCSKNPWSSTNPKTCLNEATYFTGDVNNIHLKKYRRVLPHIQLQFSAHMGLHLLGICEEVRKDIQWFYLLWCNPSFLLLRLWLKDSDLHSPK